MSFRKRFFKLRVAVLLAVLIGVAAHAAWIRRGESRRVEWSRPHVVVICPIVSERADAAGAEARLEEATAELDRWFAEQREWWTGGAGSPIELRVAPMQRTDESPPHLPDEGDSFLERWKRTRAFLKWFDEKACAVPAEAPHATRLFVYVYPKEHAAAWDGRHSVGTTRGRRGMVFASDDPAKWRNAVAVMAHELLHSVGARDHREPDGTIAHPSGYADPGKVPLLPQEKAEVMALGIPWSEDGEELVDSLDEVVLGLWTAKEIGWR